MKPSFPLFAALAAVTLLSCHTAELPISSTYTFTNALRQQVTLDVYGSATEWGRGSNRLLRYVIPAGTKQPIDLAAFQTYWIDWYTDTYTYSNWSNPEKGILDPHVSPLPKIAIADRGDAYTLTAPLRDSSRSILLAERGIESHWKMGITDDTAFDGRYEFTFRKGFDGSWTRTKRNGEVSTGAFTFTTIGFSDGFDLGLTDKTSATEFGIIIWRPTAGSRDSLIWVRGSATSPYYGIGYYPLLRQR